MKQKARQYLDSHPQGLSFLQSSFKDVKTSQKTLFLPPCPSESIDIDYSKRMCSRCELKQAEFECKHCSLSVLCLLCEKEVHCYEKFAYHNRQTLNLPLSSKSTSMKSSLISQQENKQKIQNNFEKLQSTSINLNQTWNQIINQIESKFKQTISILEDKKQEIINKILLKQKHDLGFYKDSFNSCTQSFKSPSKKYDLNSGKQNYRQFQSSELLKKNKVAFSVFNDIQAMIGKMQIRSLLTTLEQENQVQTIKKSMKGSLVIGSCVSSTASPRTKTPTNGKSWLSQSTIDIDSRFSFERMNEKNFIKSPFKETTKLLNKVRSQKLFCKSPRNLGKQKIVQFVKQSKNGIMI